MIIVIIVLTSYSQHLITIIRPSRWLGEGGGGREEGGVEGRFLWGNGGGVSLRHQIIKGRL